MLLSKFMQNVIWRRVSWRVLTDVRQKPNTGVNIAVLQTQVRQESVPSKPPGINPSVWNTQSRANTSLSPYHLLLHSMAHCSRPERERKNRSKPLVKMTQKTARRCYIAQYGFLGWPSCRVHFKAEREVSRVSHVDKEILPWQRN